MVNPFHLVPVILVIVSSGGVQIVLANAALPANINPATTTMIVDLIVALIGMRFLPPCVVGSWSVGRNDQRHDVRPRTCGQRTDPERLWIVRGQTELHQHWRALMGPLGFSQTALWVQFLSIDDRADGMITHIEELPNDPEDLLLDNLMWICGELLDSELPGGRVAFLYSRPGSRLVTEDDRAWARGSCQRPARQEFRASRSTWPMTRSCGSSRPTTSPFPAQPPDRALLRLPQEP